MNAKKLTASFLTALVMCNSASMIPFANALNTEYVLGATSETQENTKTYSLTELENYKSYDLEQTTNDGKVSISYSKQYGEIFYKLPKDIDSSLIQTLTLNISSGDKSTIGLKLYDQAVEDWIQENQVDYGNASISPEGKFVAFGIISTSEKPSAITVDSVTITLGEKTPVEIEHDIPDWKDSITKGLGSNAIAGTALNASNLNDETLLELVTKHFNAITPENEMKPESMFGYSNAKCPGTEEVTLNGEKLTVPVLNFKSADTILDKILEWNTNNPNDTIKVRGHVLVWHSQTPEWFFHVDYDKTKPYVSADEMNKRLEWYIKANFEHYLGQDSKYKDLFYGWDVVNEAVSDNGGYRTEKENPAEDLNNDTHGKNSSWWAVYQSNEYIINAFKYANKYAPKDVELYYNDYNEYLTVKRDSIVELLKAVKDAEGTRINAMGLQGHYNMDAPSASLFEDAIRAYAGVVGTVQVTEFDLKASNSYDGTDATKNDEYTKQAYRFKSLFDTMKALDAEEGIDVSGITMWGAIDSNSWLQNSSNVGGGTDGTQKQCPLLFDGDYKAKPAFWAFVDSSKLDPQIQKINVIEQVGNNSHNSYSFGSGDCTVKFIPMWSGNKLKLHVDVTDKTVDANDKVTLFVDADNSKSENIKPLTVTVNRSEATKTDNGYSADIELELSNIAVAKKIGFDLRVNDGDTPISFNDFNNTQDTNSKYYVEAVLKPYITINKGTAKIDGEKDAVWTNSKSVPLTINTGSSKVTADANLLWDEENLYLYAQVNDDVLNDSSQDDYQKDSFEVFIDENNAKADSYEQDDKQYRISFKNALSFNGPKANVDNIESATKTTENGYVVEAAFKWTDVQPKANTNIGLELQVNDADNSGSRIGTLSWFDETGMGWSAPSVFGTATLVDNNSNTGFTDVPNNYWGKQAIDFVCNKNLFNGTSETEFSPEGKMNRAMIVTVLARLAGVDTTNGSTWYEAGVKWAKENGISDGTNLNASVSREQLATMLYRYAGSPKVTGSIDGFTDTDKISSWATDAMTWAISEGLISGMGDGTVNPQGEATRAQVATIIQRFVSNVN